ncbi:Hypothetical protein I595_351 [Croceitalea dokdonensis DOKDO 023]|uniref:Lipoprotein n=1 Tax=Croceitalea dokdonensis DOKDO 023 TaxID=1300341 RepID=A0A0P7B451_9FLAO|nr:hypothetical protein [Croceitalea dokdonensis]KPM33448.1 Hypothetical protein I595_351 [Croceitalea dokdonensis DOKDO 023]
MKRISFYLSIAITALFISCSDDAAEDTMEIVEEPTGFSAELQTILTTDDVSSAVDDALAQLFIGGSTSNKGVNDCYSADYTDAGFTATFNNCVLNGSENINGTLNILYSFTGNENEYTVTFSEFFVGTTKVDGSRKVTLNTTDLEQGLSYSIASNITVEEENGRIITESGNKLFQFIFAEGEDTVWNLSGNWTVTVDNDTYVIGGNVSKPLNCEYWASGSMAIGKNGIDLDVDFGDGTCDDEALLTYPDGTTETIQL